MAAKDKYHEHVKEALIKDGWEITHDPYELSADGTIYEIALVHCPKSFLLFYLCVKLHKNEKRAY